MATDLNPLFMSRVEGFEKKAYNTLYRSNPFASLIKRRPFNPEQDGDMKKIITYKHTLPTGYPTALTQVGMSTGTGNACNTPATRIKRGEQIRQFELLQTALDTDKICLSDLKRSHDALNAIQHFEAAIQENVEVFWSDFSRVKNLAMSENKILVTGAGAIKHAKYDTAADFTGIDAGATTMASLAPQKLTWKSLDYIRMYLMRAGAASEHAIGMSNDGPVFALVTSPANIAYLKSTASTMGAQIATAINYYDPKSNLKYMGLTEAIRGWVFVPDLFPIRFGDADGLATVAELTMAKAIYPTVNFDAAGNANKLTNGSGSSLNANYLTTANGGQAQYEVATVLAVDAWEAVYESTDPSRFSKAGFDPMSWVGDVRWINNKTFGGDNDLGTLGYYRTDIRVGAKPARPDLGFSILVAAIDDGSNS